MDSQTALLVSKGVEHALMLLPIEDTKPFKVTIESNGRQVDIRAHARKGDEIVSTKFSLFIE